MAGRGSALTRAVRYFKEAELEEAEVAFELVKRTLVARQVDARKNTPAVTRKTRKARTPKADGAAVAAAKEHESLASA